MKLVKKAEAYIDSVITVFLSVLILYVCTTLFYTLVNYQKMDAAANQIINQAALCGEVNSPGFQDECIKILKRNKLDPNTVAISFENSEFLNPGKGASIPKRVQFGKNISLTLEKKGGFKYLGKKNSMALSVSVTKNKLSEKYWNSNSSIFEEDIIPDGGTYIPVGKGPLTSGKLFPEKSKPGDIYKFGDYEYKYNYYFDGLAWCSNLGQNGWGIRVLQKNKTEYGKILEVINNKPVVNMKNTFNGCTSLTMAPAIPSGIINMANTFYECTSLTGAPDMSKAANVTNMENTFWGCTSLAVAPTIPEGVTTMQHTFHNCTALKKAPTIPNGVVNMDSTFLGCTSLKEAPVIPNNVTNMSGTFSNCTSLVRAPMIPHGVTNMQKTFYSCTSLEKGPDIPDTVTNLNEAFAMCYTLKSITEVPSSVLTMSKTFNSCFSLTGKIKINANIENKENCNLCFATTMNNISLVQGENVSDITITNLLLSANGGKVTAEGYVPYGAVYYANKEPIQPCYKMPKYPRNNDSYTFWAYKYTYSSAGDGGWSVQINDSAVANKATATSFPSILERINGAPVKYLDTTFAGCSALVNVPTIPASIVSMQGTFSGCTSLKTVPSIPAGVKIMSNTFNGCKALAGNIKINANPTNYAFCFFDAGSSINSITLTGSSTKLHELAATNHNGYVTVSR